jgi:hypothetical protein
MVSQFSTAGKANVTGNDHVRFLCTNYLFGKFKGVRNYVSGADQMAEIKLRFVRGK